MSNGTKCHAYDGDETDDDEGNSSHCITINKPWVSNACTTANYWCQIQMLVSVTISCILNFQNRITSAGQFLPELSPPSIGTAAAAAAGAAVPARQFF